MNRNDWIWNKGGTYDTSSQSSSSPFNFLNHGLLGMVDNFLGWLGFGDENSSSELFGELTGYNAQQREFQQQEYLQDKQNEYNNPVNQMARMKAAGINPNTAAAGISQGGNESAQAPQVSSATQAPAAGLSAVGSAIGGGASAALALAQRRQALSQSNLFDAQANETNELLTFRKNLFSAQTAKEWSDAGMDSSLANYWSTKAAWADQQERMDFFSKVYGLNKADKELQVLAEEIKIKKNEVEISKEHVSQEEYKSRIMSVEAEAAERRAAILRKYGIDVDDSRDGMLIEAKDSGYLSFITGAFSEGVYQDTFMSEQAQLDNLGKRYQVALQNRAVELSQDVEFQKEMAKLGIKKEAFGTAVQTVLKYLFGTGFSVNVRGVGVTNTAPPK